MREERNPDRFADLVARSKTAEAPRREVAAALFSEHLDLAAIRLALGRKEPVDVEGCEFAPPTLRLAPRPKPPPFHADTCWSVAAGATPAGMEVAGAPSAAPGRRRLAVIAGWSAFAAIPAAVVLAIGVLTLGPRWDAARDLATPPATPPATLPGAAPAPAAVEPPVQPEPPPLAPRRPRPAERDVVEPAGAVRQAEMFAPAAEQTVVRAAAVAESPENAAAAHASAYPGSDDPLGAPTLVPDLPQPRVAVPPPPLGRPIIAAAPRTAIVASRLPPGLPKIAGIAVAGGPATRMPVLASVAAPHIAATAAEPDVVVAGVPPNPAIAPGEPDPAAAPLPRPQRIAGAEGPTPMMAARAIQGPIAATSAAATRVVVHYSALQPAPARGPVEATLSAVGFRRVEWREVSFGVSSTNARYFHSGDRGVSGEAVAALGGAGHAIDLRDFTHYAPSPSVGTIEIWLAR